MFACPEKPRSVALSAPDLRTILVDQRYDVLEGLYCSLFAGVADGQCSLRHLQPEGMNGWSVMETQPAFRNLALISETEHSCDLTHFQTSIEVDHVAHNGPKDRRKIHDDETKC